jgi:hypothetical protein
LNFEFPPNLRRNSEAGGGKLKTHNSTLKTRVYAQPRRWQAVATRWMAIM